MRTLGLLLISLLLAGRMAAAPAAPDVNLVPNPRFADELKHWQVEFPEANETKYQNNHTWTHVVADPAGGGKCLEFTLTGAVAASEGVKACTELIPVEVGASYEFGAEVMSTAPSPIIFIEGYKVDPTQTVAGDNQVPGYARCYRATIQVKGAGKDWKRETREITPKKGYQPTHMIVKLYGYYPEGKVYFRNVFLRKIPTPATPSPRNK